jgi:hypothetical protein
MLVHGNEVLALDHELGHWIFSCWIFPTPQPLPTSVSRGGDGSAGSERLQPEFGEAFLAGSLVIDVVDNVVVGAGHAEEVSKLKDHQPDCRILADALGVDVFAFADLAAGIDDRQRDTAWVAGAGSMITSASRNRLP